MTFGNIQSKILSGVSHQPDRSRKTIAAACLGVSLVLHLGAMALVLLAYTGRSPMPAVSYIDIKSVAATQPAAPMIHSSPLKNEKPENMEEPPPATTVQENPPESAKTTVEEIQSTKLGLGMAHGYFSSFAEGKTLRDELREYYLMLLEKINDRWWIKSETVTESPAHDAVVVFVIGRGGEVVDLKMRKSSGSRPVDRAIVETIKEMAPFPPLPESYALDGFLVPLKIAAPLRLFR